MFGRDRFVVDIKASRMTVRPRSYDLYVLGEVFGEEVYAPQHSLPANPEVVVDLGANIGAFTVWAAEVWKPKTIVAVEMEADNFSVLQENVRLNSLHAKVKILEAAVWDEDRQVGIKRNSVNAGMHEASSSLEGGNVRAVTLEKLMSSHDLKKVDILKMDVEGAEDRIFNETNEEILSRSVGYIVAEIHPTRGVQTNRILEYLRKLDFDAEIFFQPWRRTVLLNAVNTRM